jgi:uncharacterized membrane protein YdjX (TVP38/TMEM64 family)
VAAVALLWLAGRELGQYVPRFAEWVDSLGVWGPVAFVLGYAVATVAFVPGVVLTLAAGAIFGLLEGTLYVFVGATLGASGAFLLGRYVARGAVERRLEGKQRFRAIDGAVGQSGFKIVLLMRLSPVFPYNLLNYALGLTRVRFLDYLLACFGMIPGTFLYVYYGKLIGDVAAVAAGAEVERGWEYWAFLGAGIAATLVVTWFITRLARRALTEAVEPVDGAAEVTGD